jgi:hypothetical protein
MHFGRTSRVRPVLSPPFAAQVARRPAFLWRHWAELGGRCNFPGTGCSPAPYQWCLKGCPFVGSDYAPAPEPPRPEGLKRTGDRIHPSPQGI